MNKTLVQHLVEADSPSGQEQQVARRLAAAMGERGFRVQQDPVGNVVGRIGAGATPVYLVGHMDTVPGRIPVRVEGSILHGRGSVDAKGSLAVFVEAAKMFSTSDTLTLSVIGCVDEEAASRGARYLLESHSPPAFVVIGEPSGWDALTLGYKGSLSLTYHLRKPRAHRGADVATPVEDAVTFYNALCRAYPDRGSGFNALSLNLTAINSATVDNDETVDMHFNIRTPLGFDVGALISNAQGIDKSARLAWTDPIPAVLADKRNALVRAFLGALRASGVAPKFKRKTGTSDMNLLAAWRCPILAYGPGDSALDHTPNEHLDLREYERSIGVLTNALRRLESF